MPIDQQRETMFDQPTGARRLTELPQASTVLEYFERNYYADITSGVKAVDIRRAKEGGEAAKLQSDWMRETIYSDIADMIESRAPGCRVIEIGCGLGDLLADLKGRGFETTGIEISPDAVDHARARGLNVLQGAYETLEVPICDAVLFVNVLEQMSDPLGVLKRARGHLSAGGLVIIRSGNDFNPLQLALRDQLDKGEYWVVKDHIWYFDYDSLETMLRRTGFEPICRRSDFPMEMFPLMGIDYLADPEAGQRAHLQRVSLERNVPAKTRRALYEAFAAAGLGRCAFVVGIAS